MTETVAKVDRVLLGDETNEAMSCLLDHEHHFMRQTAATELPGMLSVYLSQWMSDELEKKDCDLEKVGRFAAAIRNLNALRRESWMSK